MWCATKQVSEAHRRRIAADPEGGLRHRLWMHSMLAALANPLVAAMIKGQPGLFQGLMGAFDQRARNQLVGNADTYVAQLQQAGLIRADLPVPVITYLIAALKMGIITAPDLVGQDHLPSMDQLAQALSDLIRPCLSPKHLPPNPTLANQALGESLPYVSTL